MTDEQKNYSCTHGYAKAGECPICIKMYDDIEDWNTKQLAHISRIKSEMKLNGFKHARDYLNYLAIK